MVKRKEIVLLEIYDIQDNLALVYPMAILDKYKINVSINNLRMYQFALLTINFKYSLISIYFDEKNLL